MGDVVLLVDVIEPPSTLPISLVVHVKRSVVVNVAITVTIIMNKLYICCIPL